MGRVFANSPGDLGSIPGRIIQRLLKWYSIPPCLTHSNIRYVSKVEWTNPGKGVAASPTSQCSSYWKESLLVALDYGRHLYFYTYYIYAYIHMHIYMCVCLSLSLSLSIYIYIHICIHIYVYTYMYIHIYVYIHAYIYIILLTYIYIYIYIYIYWLHNGMWYGPVQLDYRMSENVQTIHQSQYSSVKPWKTRKWNWLWEEKQQQSKPQDEFLGAVLSPLLVVLALT